MLLERLYNWPVTMYQGVGLCMGVPSELLEAQVQAKWYLTCSFSILKIVSGQFPEARCSLCSHLVGNSVSSMKLWVSRKFLIPFHC